MTAMAMRCWRWSSRVAPRVTRDSAPASTGASSSRRRHTRCSRSSSGRSQTERRPVPGAPTRLGFSTIPSSPGPRCRRRPRRWRGRPARSRTIAWPRRRPTSFTTWPWCCASGACRCPTPSGCSMAVARAEPSLAAASTSLDEVRELANEYNLIPLLETFVDDIQTPVSAFLRLRRRGEPAFLLESADQGRVGRYSFIGFRPRKVLRWSPGEGGDPYALLEKELAGFRPAPTAGEIPFTGGAVGMFAYDLVRTAEPTVGEPNPDTIGLPDLAVMLTDALVIFDHLKHTLTVLANVFAGKDLEASYADALATIAEVRRRLSEPVAAPDTASV